MGYALFAQNKLVISGMVNSVQQQQTMRSDEQMRLSTNTLTLQARVTNTQASQAAELGVLYRQLSEATESTERQRINDQILAIQKDFDREIAVLQNEITEVSTKENAIEMEVKRLDTKLSALQKQMDAVQDAEGKGIEKSTPKFSGMG